MISSADFTRSLLGRCLVACAVNPRRAARRCARRSSGQLLGRSGGRRWGGLMAASGELSDRLRGGSHGRRHLGEVTRNGPYVRKCATPSQQRRSPLRATTAFSRLLRLRGVWVRHLGFEPDRLVATATPPPAPPDLPSVGVLHDGRPVARPGGTKWDRHRQLTIASWPVAVLVPSRPSRGAQSGT